MMDELAMKLAVCLSLAALICLAAFWKRSERNIYKRYRKLYGSKILFSACPELSKVAEFQSRPGAETQPFNLPGLMAAFGAVRETVEKWKIQIPFNKKERLKQDLDTLQDERTDAPPSELTDEVWRQLTEALRKRKEQDAAIKRAEKELEAMRPSSLDDAKWQELKAELKRAFEKGEAFAPNDELPYVFPDIKNPLILHTDRASFYWAAHTRTAREVVFSIIKDDDRERLEQVMVALRDHKSVGIPRIEDFHFEPTEKAFYAVMEFVGGFDLKNGRRDWRTLEDLLKSYEVEKKAVGQARCLNWTHDLLQALKTLHGRRVLHNDVQASNIVVDGDYAYLIDFSKAVAFASEDKSEGADVSQDLCQLGALMFRMLTGEALEKDKKPEARKAALVAHDVSAPVIDVILKAVERGYQSADAMLSDLEAMVKRGEEIRRNRQCKRLVLACALIGLLGGFYGWRSVEHQLRRVAEMRGDANKAASMFAEGDYSQALELARTAATREGNDPPVPADAERVLADILGVYDLSAGYKPDYSIGGDVLSGRPLKAAVSPDGKRLAVMVANNSGDEPAFYLRFFDAQSEKELAQPVKMYPSALSEFEFWNERILFYAGEQGLTVCSLPETPPENGIPPAVSTLCGDAPATGIAISADRSIAASVWRDAGAATLYRIVGDGDSVRLEDKTTLPFGGKTQSALTYDTFTDPMDNLFELDERGERLALSFSDGSLYIANVSGFWRWNQSETAQEVSPDVYEKISLPSPRYEHFEGGFHGGFFLYSASTKSLRPEAIRSYAQVIRTDSMEAVTGLSMTEETPFRAHACADSDAAYLTIENTLRRADFASETWEAVDYADANITLLRHGAGRVLIVTANDTALAYDEREGKVEVSAGTPYNIAALAGDTLLIASQNRPTLSVLRWKEREPILTYPADFEHLCASVQADFSSAILYRSRECMVIFQSSDLSPVPYAFEDWGKTLKQGYQRDPDGDKLVTVYADRIEYRDAKNPDNVVTDADTKTDPNAPDAFSVGAYFIEARLNDSIVIRNLSTGKDILTLNRETFKDAFPCGENLIVSLLSIDGTTQYSFLMNPQGETLADLPNLCDVLPDGTLVFDYAQGKLFSGLLYSTDDLLRLASDRRNERT